MYQVEILKDNNWEYLFESKDIHEIDKVVWKLTNLRPNKAIQILQDDIVLCFLDGTEYQYWYWKNKYVRNKGVGYDHIKSYHEYCKKKEMKSNE